jgi:hypothetical protein
MRTREELKQLAVDIHGGRVFTDTMLSTPEEGISVFMPLSLMNEEQKDAFIKENPVFLFEYLNKAGPMAVNGKPIFFSFQFLVKEELEILRDIYKKLVEAVDKL